MAVLLPQKGHSNNCEIDHARQGAAPEDHSGVHFGQSEVTEDQSDPTKSKKRGSVGMRS